MPLIESDDLKIVKLDLNDRTPVSRDELHREIDNIEDKFTNLLSEKDKAIILLQNKVDAEPSISVVNERLMALDKLINTQIRERDNRVTEVKQDGEKNIQAALLAAEKAVGKTEASFTKELDAVKDNAITVADGLRREISDLKDRYNSTEGQKKGMSSSMATLIATVGAIAIMVGSIAAVVSIFHH